VNRTHSKRFATYYVLLILFFGFFVVQTLCQFPHLTHHPIHNTLQRMPATVVNPYRRQLWPLLILVLLTVAIRAPLLGIPFERDEGEYAYIGWRLEHHELPYRDWVDQKPPAIFWVYRLAFFLPMDPVRAVHFMVLLFAAASACALFFLALRFMGQWPAFVAALVFTLLSSDPLLYGSEANTEMFMLLPLILSVLAFFAAVSAAGQGRKILFAALAGVFIGVATAFKQVGAMQWPVFILMFPLFADAKKPLLKMFFFAAWSALGIAAVWLAMVLYFAVHHAVHDFFYNVFTHNLQYVQGVSGARRQNYLADTLKSLAKDEVPVWVASVIGIVWVFVSGRRKEFLFLLLWLVASAVGVSASGYYFPHYFQQWLSALCVAAALGVDALDRFASLKRIPATPRRTTLTLAVTVLVAVELWPFVFTDTPAQAADKIYPDNHFAEKQVLAARLAEVTKPDDRVFIFGAEPEMFFYARRVSATRYIFLFPLYGPYSDARERQIAAADEITSNAPAAALYLPNRLFFTPDSEQYFTQWSLNYISQNFRMDSCLAFDKTGAAVVVTDVPNQKASAIDGLKVFGSLDVRKSPAPP